MIKDNGGSRSGKERRQFAYNDSTPDRRSGKDRRKGIDRRSGYGQKRCYQDPANLNPVAIVPIGVPAHPTQRATTRRDLSDVVTYVV